MPISWPDLPPELLEQIATHLAGRPPQRLSTPDLTLDAFFVRPSSQTPALRDLRSLRQVDRRTRQLVDSTWPSLLADRIACRVASRRVDGTERQRSPEELAALAPILATAQHLAVADDHRFPFPYRTYAHALVGPSAQQRSRPRPQPQVLFQPWHTALPRVLRGMSSLTQLWIELEDGGRNLGGLHHLPPTLRHLTIVARTPAGFSGALRRPLPAQLTSLGLCSARLTRSDWAQLLAALPVGLRRLAVRQIVPPFVVGGIARPPVAIATRARALTRLRLDVGGLRSEDFQVGLSGLQRLHTLQLNTRTGAAIQAHDVARALPPSVRHLGLSGFVLRDGGGAHLLQVACNQLWDLVLAGGRLDDGALPATAAGASCLQRLALTDMQLGEHMARWLLFDLPAGLRHLQIRGLDVVGGDTLHGLLPRLPTTLQQLDVSCLTLTASQLRHRPQGDQKTSPERVHGARKPLPPQLVALRIELKRNQIADHFTLLQGAPASLRLLAAAADEAPVAVHALALQQRFPRLHVALTPAARPDFPDLIVDPCTCANVGQ